MLFECLFGLCLVACGALTIQNFALVNNNVVSFQINFPNPVNSLTTSNFKIDHSEGNWVSVNLTNATLTQLSSTLWTMNRSSPPLLPFGPGDYRITWSNAPPALCPPVPPDLSPTTDLIGNGTSGNCTEATIRAVISGLNAQNKSGVIRFACGPSMWSIKINTEFFVTAPLTLDGGGLIEFDGQFKTRILNFSSTSDSFPSWTIQGVRFVNATSAFTTAEQGGGAIYAKYGVLNILDCDFYTNVASSNTTTRGGAVLSWFGVTTISGSIFWNNVASIGGAISKRAGNLISINSYALNNTAWTNGTNGKGGAMEGEGFGNLTLCGCSLFNNTAFFVGSALYRFSGNTSYSISIASSDFAGNRIYSPTATNGGAVHLEDAQVTVSTSIIRDNGATAGDAGLFLKDVAALNLSDVTFSNNFLAGGGGSALSFGSGVSGNMSHCTLSGNAPPAINGTAQVSCSNSIIINSNGPACNTTLLQDSGSNIQYPPSGASCVPNAANANPQLQPLQDEGCPTYTFPVGNASLANRGAECPNFPKTPHQSLVYALGDMRPEPRTQTFYARVSAGAVNVTLSPQLSQCNGSGIVPLDGSALSGCSDSDSYGSNCTFACNTGYNLTSGLSTLPCNLTISGPYPKTDLAQCKLITCNGTQGQPTNSKLGNCGPSDPFNTTCTVACAQGFFNASGTPIRQCLASGFYSLSNLSCLPILCNATILPLGAVIVSGCINDSYSESCQLQCDDGFLQTSGSNSFLCNQNGPYPLNLQCRVGCHPNLYLSGGRCYPCASAASSPGNTTSDGCTCNSGYQGNGLFCYLTQQVLNPSTEGLQVILRLTEGGHTDNITAILEHALSVSLNIPENNIIWETTVNYPNGTSDLTFDILTKDNATLVNVTTILINQIGDKNSTLHKQLPPIVVIDDHYYHFSLLGLVFEDFQRLPVYMIVLIVVLIATALVVIYILICRSFPGAENFRLVSLILTLLALASKIFFILFLSTLRNYTNMWEFQLSLASLIAPPMINLSVTLFCLYYELKLNGKFKDWYHSEHHFVTAVCVMGAMISARNMKIISSEIFGSPSFSAPLSQRAELLFIFYGAISNVLSDVPQVICQVTVSINLKTFQTAAVIALVSTLISLVFGLFNQTRALSKLFSPEQKAIGHSVATPVVDSSSSPGGISRENTFRVDSSSKSFWLRNPSGRSLDTIPLEETESPASASGAASEPETVQHDMMHIVN